jgi:hypothetical protein
VPSGYVRLHGQICNLAASPTLPETKASRSQANGSLFSQRLNYDTSRKPSGSHVSRPAAGASQSRPIFSPPPAFGGLQQPTAHWTGPLPQKMRTPKALPLFPFKPDRATKPHKRRTDISCYFGRKTDDSRISWRILGPNAYLAISPFIAISVDHLRPPLASTKAYCFPVKPPSLLPSLAASDGLVKTRFLQRVA